MVRVSDVLHSNHVCSIWQPCASDSGSKIAVSAHGMRKVQTLAFAVSRSVDWCGGRDVMLRNMLPQIDPTLNGARRRSTASARIEAEPRTRTTARTLVSAAMRSRTSRSLPPPERRPLTSVDVRMVGKTLDDTIIGLAAGHSGHAHPPACVPPAPRDTPSWCKRWGGIATAQSLPQHRLALMCGSGVWRHTRMGRRWCSKTTSRESTASAGPRPAQM